MKVWRWHVMQMKLYARKLRSVGKADTLGTSRLQTEITHD